MYVACTLILWVYLFDRLESCKSNDYPNYLVCSTEIFGISPLSTFQIAGRQRRSAGDNQGQFWRLYTLSDTKICN